MSLKQLEPTVKTVGDYDYYITPFKAFESVQISADLLSVLAPLAGALAPLAKVITDDDKKENENKNENENESILDADVTPMITAAAEALSNCAIDGSQIVKLMKKLLLGGNIVVNIPDDEGEDNPQRLDIDLANEIFCGETQDMFVLCVYVIELNYKGFFKKLAGQSGNRMPAAKPRKIL